LCCLIAAVVLLGPAIAVAEDIEYSHGMSFIEPLKYPPDFPHFDFVNPDAPKGGQVSYPELGTFDSFNYVIDKGRVVMGIDLLLPHRNLIYDRLIEAAIDETASYYGRLADGVWIAEDYAEFAFRIREGAYWHDGKPLTVEDVVFTFETYIEHGSATIRTALLEVDKIEQIGPREAYFKVKEGAEANPMLPIAVGTYPILPKHFWADRDITKTTIKPPLGSGPYKIGDFTLGRYANFERVEDYWGQDIPVMKGRYNWDGVKFDYFRDETIMVEALKSGVLDVRNETASKQWVNDYDFPAVKAGLFKKDLIDLDRVWGMDVPVIWNLDCERFQDIRVREALWYLFDFQWANRVLMYGFYHHADSFFFNSKMAASGLPTPEELELLEPFRDQLPERVFTQAWRSLDTTGYGHDRGHVIRALELFEEAGWVIQDGVMTNVETGEAFEIDFIFVAPMLLRATMPFISALNRVGIQTTARSPELSNWQYQMRSGKFDGGCQRFLPNNIPGLTLRNWFSSASADKEFSLNWMNLRDPVVDNLIEKVVVASNARDFYAATRALDRVLLWQFYVIPSMAQPGFRLVYWDKFGQPENAQRLQRESWLDTWWWDPEKVARVVSGVAELTGGSH
jgi:microcin C transport system substrate-binding protein